MIQPVASLTTQRFMYSCYSAPNQLLSS